MQGNELAPLVWIHMLQAAITNGLSTRDADGQKFATCSAPGIEAVSTCIEGRSRRRTIQSHHITDLLAISGSSLGNGSAV
jgi:hypothetical protein